MKAHGLLSLLSCIKFLPFSHVYVWYRCPSTNVCSVSNKMCVSQVWKLGWSPKRGGEFGTALPEIPVEFLQEKDVFREFLYRINVLGKRGGRAYGVITFL